MKDSLKYCGALLWNSVCYYKQEVGRFSLNNLKKTPTNETTLKNSNLTYFPLQLLVLYILIFFLRRSYNMYYFLLSNSS